MFINISKLKVIDSKILIQKTIFREIKKLEKIVDGLIIEKIVNKRKK